MRKIGGRARSGLIRRTMSLLRKPLEWRLRHHSFHYPLELWLSLAREWLTVRRSLLTGTGLSRALSK